MTYLVWIFLRLVYGFGEEKVAYSANKYKIHTHFLWIFHRGLCFVLNTIILFSPYLGYSRNSLDKD